jgi:hypothetical protein
MDLLRTMVQNRQASGMSMKAEPPKKRTGTGDDGLTPGTKAYRDYIIEKKPAKKKLKVHFNAMVEKLCESEEAYDTE